jgi:hypothetical protein
LRMPTAPTMRDMSQTAIVGALSLVAMPETYH